MAHKRKDTISDSHVEYRKHLRPWEKRKEAKNERKAAKNFVRAEMNEIDYSVFSHEHRKHDGLQTLQDVGLQVLMHPKN